MKSILTNLLLRSEHIEILKKNNDFRKLFIANVLSNFGTQLHRFALPWIVYNISGSAQLMAVNFTISLIPALIFGVIGGTLSDRYNRKKILITSDLLSVIFTLGIFLIHYSFELKVLYLFILTFVLSSINSVFTPAFRAGMQAIVEKDDLLRANTIFSIAQSFISLGGPIIAGMAIGFLGPWINIVINAISFGISAVLIMNIKLPLETSKESKEKSDFYSNVVEGLKVVKGTRWLLLGILLTFGVSLGNGSVGSLIQYYLRHTLGISGTLFGISFALFEFLPMLIAGHYASKIGKRFKVEKILLCASFLYAISLIGMGVTTIYAFVIISGMLLNVAAVLILVNWNTMLQQNIPNRLLGRVFGTVLTFQSVGLLIGASASSFLTTYYSPQWILISFGVLTGLFTLVTFHPFINSNSHPIEKSEVRI